MTVGQATALGKLHYPRPRTAGSYDIFHHRSVSSDLHIHLPERSLVLHQCQKCCQSLHDEAINHT